VLCISLGNCRKGAVYTYNHNDIKNVEFVLEARLPRRPYDILAKLAIRTETMVLVDLPSAP
jgi:hypothetical protein